MNAPVPVRRIKPSVMVQHMLQLNGVPFSLKEYPYLIPIYDTDCPEVGMFTARQIAKSTTLASIAVEEAVLLPRGNHQVIVFPLQEQAYVFATQRLRDFIHDSPIITKGFFSGTGFVDQMLRKQFNNGNIISLGYAQRTADRLRGRSAGKIKFDEVQDIFPEVIPVVREIAFRSSNPSYWYCGTPKSKDNYMEKLRHRSTAAEWAVKCPAMGCKKWNHTWDDSNIGDTGVICSFCGKPLNTDQGQWVVARKLDRHLGKNAKVTMESYRIPQLIVRPIMNQPTKWLELLEKRRNYSKELFLNEVLGSPADSGSKPVTIEELTACCNSSRRNVLPDPHDPTVPPLVMGLDWAVVGEQSFTVMTVGGWSNFPNKFKLYYYKIFRGADTDQVKQVNEAIEVFKKYNIRLIGSDWGMGQTANIMLVNALGENCVAQMWHTGLKGGKAMARARWEPKTRKWHLARTAVLTDVFEAIKRRHMEFPTLGDCHDLFRHILAETLEYRPETNTLHYTNVEADDCLHSLCFGTLAGELLINGDFRGHQGSTTSQGPWSNNDPWNEESYDVEASMYGQLGHM